MPASVRYPNDEERHEYAEAARGREAYSYENAEEDLHGRNGASAQGACPAPPAPTGRGS
jgi:hypothetical protein